MAWDDGTTTELDRKRVEGWLLTALALFLALSALGMGLGRDSVGGLLRGSLGSAERDQAIAANPELVEGTLMSLDPVGPDRWLVSYEYFHGVELFVGYARIPTDATLELKHLEPLDVELAADRPEHSRPAGVVLAPSGWITDGWNRWAWWLAGIQLGLAGLLGALGVTRVRRSR